MIEDDSVISEEDIKKLYSGIDFAEEILQNNSPSTSSPIFPENDILSSSIGLGDELNLEHLLGNSGENNILQSIDTNVDISNPNFDLNLDELLNQPCDLSTQEMDFHMNNFLESDITKEIQEVTNII